MGSASAPAPSFPEQQSPASSGEGPAVNREGTAVSQEGAESQAGNIVPSADTPSSFPPPSDSGGGEGDVLVKQNTQVFPPREGYLSKSEVDATNTTTVGPNTEWRPQ